MLLKDHILVVRVNPDSLPCDSSSGDAPKGPGTVLSYLYFQNSWQNQVLYQMGDNVTVSCPDSDSYMSCPRASHQLFFSLEQGIHVTWVFEEKPVMNINSWITFHGEFCAFFTKMCSCENDFSDSLALGEKVYVPKSNYSIMNITRKTWMSEQIQFKRNKKHTAPQCGLAPGTKADTILEKSPSHFPCPLQLLFYYPYCPLLVQCWLLLYYGYLFLVLVHDLRPWNSWNLLSSAVVWRRALEETWEAFLIDVISHVIDGG